jgi:hypothetical protein
MIVLVDSPPFNNDNIYGPLYDLLQRVMPNSFFILLRYFLRIDGVMLRLNDTRYYHEFDTDFILREYTSKEAKAQALNVSKQTSNSVICRKLK